MKLFKFLFSLAIALGVGYALNTKFGQIPPLGKFLDPFSGFWQNATDTSEEPSETLQLGGLTAPVSVVYDKHLIPHVFAQNNSDLYKAQGYITAIHRLWQMDFQPMAAAGRLSEVVGAVAADYDREQRRKGMTFGAEVSLQTIQQDRELYDLLLSYTDGVNQYISSLDYADYPVEYKLLDYQPEPWTPLKTTLLLMYMTDNLAGGDSDLENTNTLKLFGSEVFNLLYPNFPKDLDPVIPSERDLSDFDVNRPDRPDSLTFPLELTAQTIPRNNPLNGSNNWAVSGGRTASGNAMLANDPHLGLNMPSLWFAMQLSTPDNKMFGVTLPGAMGAVIGFNDSIAWGLTNATRDVRDWYKITFQDESRKKYRYGSEWRDTDTRIEEIKIRGQESVYDTVIYTHYGPVVYDHQFLGNEELSGYALKWIGHLPGNRQKTLVQLNRAHNYDAAIHAIKDFTGPAQNFLIATTTGDIGLYIQGKFANKWPDQGKFLMDGADPTFEWQGFIPQEHNANIKNPQQGFLSSANQHPVDQAYPYYVYDGNYEHYRNRVINGILRENDQVTMEDFRSLHNNNLNLKAEEIVPYMLDQMDASALSDREKEVLGWMQSWDFYYETDQKEPPVFELWWSEVRRSLWDEFMDLEVDVYLPNSYQTIQFLKENADHELIDNKSTDERESISDLFVQGFQKAVERFDEWEEQNGTNRWADYKQTQIQHLLRLDAFSAKNVQIGGNSGIVNATSRSHGPSWRMIVELDDVPKAWGVYPGGQSGNPGSPYYDSFVDSWAGGNYFEILFLSSPESNSDQILYSQTLQPSAQ